jgi:hypothetical protein
MVIHADVLISAGHEGRPASCKRFPQHKCNLGAAGEREWTPIVADEATRILRAHGVKVVRLPADFAGTYDVKEAVFIHFDGASPPCTSRASIGYPPGAAGAAAAVRCIHGIGRLDSCRIISPRDCAVIMRTNRFVQAKAH